MNCLSLVCLYSPHFRNNLIQTRPRMLHRHLTPHLPIPIKRKGPCIDDLSSMGIDDFDGLPCFEVRGDAVFGRDGG